MTLAEPNAGSHFVWRSRAQSTTERLNLLVTPGLRVRDGAAQFGRPATVMGNAQAKGPQNKNRAHKKYVHWDQAGKQCCTWTVMAAAGAGGRGAQCSLTNQSTEASNKAIIITCICVQVNETHLCDRFVVWLCLAASVHAAISSAV